MLLGHYIQHYVNWSWDKTLAVALPLLIGGFLITYSGYSYIMELPDKTPEQIELFWTYNTPNVAMMTLACFLLVYRIRIPQDSRLASWLASLTTCGFGIYMIHYFLVCVGYDLGAWLHIPAPLRIPFSALTILTCSWTLVYLTKKMLGKRSIFLLG
jgi:surface polysaccharide O-acyltransferase-like enzyme